MPGCLVDEEGVVGGDETRVVSAKFLPQFLPTSGLVIGGARVVRFWTLVRRILAPVSVQFLSGIGSSHAIGAYFAADP